MGRWGFAVAVTIGALAVSAPAARAAAPVSWYQLAPGFQDLFVFP